MRLPASCQLLGSSWDRIGTAGSEHLQGFSLPFALVRNGNHTFRLICSRTFHTRWVCVNTGDERNFLFLSFVGFGGLLSLQVCFQIFSTGAPWGPKITLPSPVLLSLSAAGGALEEEEEEGLAGSCFQKI